MKIEVIPAAPERKLVAVANGDLLYMYKGSDLWVIDITVNPAGFRSIFWKTLEGVLEGHSDAVPIYKGDTVTLTITF